MSDPRPRENHGGGQLANPLYLHENMAPGAWPAGGLPMSRALPLSTWKDKQASVWTQTSGVAGTKWTWTWSSPAFDFRPELRDGENEAPPGSFVPINHQGAYGLGNTLLLIVRTIGLYGVPGALVSPADFPELRGSWWDEGDNYDGTVLPRLHNPHPISDYINDGGSSIGTNEGASVIALTPCGVRFWKAYATFEFWLKPGSTIVLPPALQVRASLGI